MSYAPCKGRRAFVILPGLGQPAFLVWLISINFSCISIGCIHLHPADDSRKVQPAAEVVFQCERNSNETTWRKTPLHNCWGEVWVLFKCDSAHATTLLGLPGIWSGKSVPLTAIHQGAAGFEYKMCILVSILLLIMEWAQVMFMGRFALLVYFFHLASMHFTHSLYEWVYCMNSSAHIVWVLLSIVSMFTRCIMTFLRIKLLLEC